MSQIQQSDNKDCESQNDVKDVVTKFAGLIQFSPRDFFFLPMAVMCTPATKHAPKQRHRSIKPQQWAYNTNRVVASTHSTRFHSRKSPRALGTRTHATRSDSSYRRPKQVRIPVNFTLAARQPYDNRPDMLRRWQFSCEVCAHTTNTRAQLQTKGYDVMKGPLCAMLT